jgi:carbamate kinase
MGRKGKRVVIALGGNALQSKVCPPTSEAQLDMVKKTCQHLADIKEAGYEIVIVHGNGPQVGRIVLASEAAKDFTPPMPFDVCGAMSQGYIGYHIQQALGGELRKRGWDLPVVSLVTQVLVEENDPCFQHPTKPIGPFYSQEEAEEISEKSGYIMKEDAGRGYRRVVASPMPVDIVEIEGIRSLFESALVIACGGGGIPVIHKADQGLEGIAAVIDKDYAAELLAEMLDADILLILTEVEKACLNFNQANQEELNEITVEEARRYMQEDHFARGSMLPKIMAASKFVASGVGKKAIITSLDKGLMALSGETGTSINR